LPDDQLYFLENNGIDFGFDSSEGDMGIKKIAVVTGLSLFG